MSDITAIEIRDYIREIPDFPKPGILFRDITPLLASPTAFRVCIDRLCENYADDKIDVIVAAEARGFIFGAPMALEMKIPFVPIRKPGKLPFDRHSFEYDLEYGTDTLEMHIDAVSHGENVLVVDDLLATGGTVAACCKLLEKCGAHVIGSAFVIELVGLGGAERLDGFKPFSLIKY